MKWAQLYGKSEHSLSLLFLGLEWKLTFSRPVVNCHILPDSSSEAQHRWGFEPCLCPFGHTALSVQFWLCNILSSCSDFMQAESECHSFLLNTNYFLMVLDIKSVFQSLFSFWLSEVRHLLKKVYSSYLYNDKTLTKFKIKMLSQVAFPIPFQM